MIPRQHYHCNYFFKPAVYVIEFFMVQFPHHISISIEFPDWKETLCGPNLIDDHSASFAAFVFIQNDSKLVIDILKI